MTTLFLFFTMPKKALKSHNTYMAGSTACIRGKSLFAVMAGATVLTFIRAGIDPVKAGLLAARVIDWRDADHSVQTFGMEDRAYSAIGKDYGAKDARFEDLAELLLLEGIDDYTFRMIKDYFTVYSNRSGELYSIVSKASKHDGSSSYNTRVIVQLTHQSGSPYRMLKWQHEQD